MFIQRTKRAGWVLRNVHDPESVADHMYRMATMAFLVDSKTGLNKERYFAKRYLTYIFFSFWMSLMLNSCKN